MKWPFGSKTEETMPGHAVDAVTFKGKPVKCPRCDDATRLRLAWDTGGASLGAERLATSALGRGLEPTDGVVAMCLACGLVMDAEGAWFDRDVRRKAAALLEKSLVAFGHIEQPAERPSGPPFGYAPLSHGPFDEAGLRRKFESLDSILETIALEISRLRSGK